MMTVRQATKRGFLLLEMVLALAIFAMATTGFVVALHRMSQAASMSQNEARVSRILDSAMSEAMSVPMLEPGETRYEIGNTGIEVLTLVEQLDELETDDGAVLQEMFRIKVIARWYENGAWEERVAETWRYGLMYQS